MEAYFTVESTSPQTHVTFRTLRTRLIHAVNARVQNGEFTERGLAKLLGISQPQIHNVLKGARNLRWELADRLLGNLGMTVSELLQGENLAIEDGGRMASMHALATRHSLNRELDGDERIARKQPGRELRITSRERTVSRQSAHI
jgi:transcriptional regulator with XRE-family HTH domain